MTPPDKNGWMPIDTAPHATDVLLWVPDTEHTEGFMEASWASGGERIGQYSNMWVHGRATHWQPLPKPPVTP